jgi:hypothetical protein
MRQQKKDQIIRLVEQRNEANLQIIRDRMLLQEIEAQLDQLLEGAETAPIRRTRRAARKARPEVSTKKASKSGAYEKLSAAIQKKSATHKWTRVELTAAAGVAEGSIHDLITRALKERLLKRDGYGIYVAGPQGNQATIN